MFVHTMINNKTMKARASSLNPNATSYVPLTRKVTPDERKGYEPGNKSDSFKFKSQLGFESYGSSSHSADLAQKQALDVDLDINLAYLQMIFPGVSDKSFSRIYTECRGNMEATVEKLSQLKLPSGDFTENLPDSLDIDDVSLAYK